MVFGILVNWFSFRFFPSCLSTCLAKCKQKLLNILITSPKSDQKPKMGWSGETKVGFKQQSFFQKESGDSVLWLKSVIVERLTFI